MANDAVNEAGRRFPVPILEGLRPFDKRTVGPEALAGLTLAALAIPEVMGYGMPKIPGALIAGGRSQLAQLAAGAIVVVVLLFLTVPLQYMPNAVLASIVFLIALELVDIAGMRKVFAVRLDEFVVAAITALITDVITQFDLGTPEVAR
jgi:MFS superfamily sulfate permease-like transporter